jgi:hypothetical protein
VNEGQHIQCPSADDKYNVIRNVDLTCWETEEARDWALSLQYYNGPTCFIP